MPNRRHVVLFLMFLAAAFALGDEVRVVPASHEAKSSAAASVRTAVTSQDVDVLEKMFEAPVLCGPRLWQQLRTTMPDDKNRVGTATLMYDPGSGRESWDIRALDLKTVPDEVRKTLEAIIESAPGRIAVESGVFRGTGVKLLAAALRERYLRGEISVSQASKEDLYYYWLMIPYDIEEPVLRIDTAQSSFLVDMNENGRVMWIDLLPEDIASVERSAK